MRFRWGGAVLGLHEVWMEQVRDCGVWSTRFVLERKTIYKTEALANWHCWRVVGQSAASTAATDPCSGESSAGAGKERGTPGSEVGEGVSSASQNERPDSKWHNETAALIRQNKKKHI